MTTKTTESKIETLARDCADEAWEQMLSSYHVERRDGEMYTVGGPNDSKPLQSWEPIGGDWDALNDALGRKAEHDERIAFDRAYQARLRERIEAVE